MGTIRDLGRRAWRKYLQDGVSSSGFHKPVQEQIFEFVDAVEDGIAGASAGLIQAVNWPTLNGLSGTRVGQPGRCPNTTGTHVDPVTGDTVNNQADYTWNGTSWRWVADYIDVSSILDSKADQVDLDETNAHLAYVEGPPLLDSVYRSVVTDENGNIKLGYRIDGTVDVLNHYPLLDSEFKYVLRDEAGSVFFGVRHDDTIFSGSGAESVSTIAYTLGDRVMVHDGVVRAPITFETGFGYVLPSIAGAICTYYADDGTVVTRKTEQIEAATTLSGAVTDVVHFLLYGQSLSDGAFSSPAAHVAAVRAGRAVMFNAGVRTRGAQDALLPFLPANMYSWVDLREPIEESPGPGLGWALTAVGGLASTEAALVSAHGNGGASYATIKKGTQPYANQLEAVRRGRVMGSLNGLGYEVGAVDLVHGEADRADLAAVYQAKVEEFQADMTTDANALSGGTAELLLALSQMSSWTAYGDAASGVPDGQLKAALDNPTKIICTGPRYHLTYNADGIHLPAASSARLGSYDGRAIRQTRAGSPFLPLYCTGAVRVGAVVTLTYHVPVGPLAFDTTAVSNPGNYGFQWVQTGGTARTISSVAIVGSTVVITLSGDPGSPSAQTVKVAMNGAGGEDAGPTTGPRCNLRDSASDLDIDGNTMPNWACHQTITVS